MSTAFDELSQKEKEALRLLAAGHSAKSAAAELDLSVYTLNDRLRDARKKLRVTSSREAARLLAEYEGESPKNLVPKDFGISHTNTSADAVPHHQPKTAQRNAAVWIAGAALMISLGIAATIFFSGVLSVDKREAQTVSASHDVATTGEVSARAWVALIDQSRWEESWEKSGTIFREAVTSAEWARQARPVREPLGAVIKRTLVANEAHKELPNAPKGEYRILQFASDYANRPGSVDTVILAQEGEHWFVVGYFIR